MSLEIVVIPDCGCAGELDHDVLPIVRHVWADGRAVTVPQPCVNSDLGPSEIRAQLGFEASFKVFHPGGFPASEIQASTSRLDDEHHVMISGDIDEDQRVVLVRGALQEALAAWWAEALRCAVAGPSWAAVALLIVQRAIPDDVYDDGFVPVDAIDGASGLYCKIEGPRLDMMLESWAAAAMTWAADPGADPSAVLRAWLERKGPGDPNTLP